MTPPLAAAASVAGLLGFGNTLGATDHGLTWKSDQVTFPSDLSMAGPSLNEVRKPAIKFSRQDIHYPNASTVFTLEGRFSRSTDQFQQEGDRVMANVGFHLRHDTSTYWWSSLTFNADASPTPVGTNEDPRVEFRLHGRFDPFGGGDATYDVLLQVDQHGAIHLQRFDTSDGTFYALSDGDADGLWLYLPMAVV